MANQYTNKPARFCSISDCNNRHYAKTFCRRHYLWKDPFALKVTFSNPICLIETCELKTISKGYCNKHYRLFIRYGDPLYLHPRFGKGSTSEEKFWSKVKLTADDERCWEWQGCVNEKGYGKIQRNNKRYYAHRFAWLLVKGIEPQMFLLHSCDNPICVNPKHLREGTQKDNINDCIERGRKPVGDKCSYAKLTNKQVKKIKQMLRDGIPQPRIAVEIGITDKRVSAINTGKAWKSVILEEENDV